jgi:hypothetical protein
MKHSVKTRLAVGILACHLLTFIYFFILSLPWYFSRLLRYHSTFMIIGSVSLMAHLLLAFILFIVNWVFCPVKQAWDFPIRYVDHDCVAAHYLEQGVLMRVKYGNAFGLVWAAWCLTYLVGFFALTPRLVWLEVQKPLIVATARTSNNVMSGQGKEEAKPTVEDQQAEKAPKVEERTEEQERKEKDEDATLCEDSTSVRTNRTIVAV